MKHYKKFILLLILVLSLSSCDWLMEVYGIRKRRKVPPQEIAESDELVQEVQSTELAKLIIKPNPKTLRVKRDPFKPLFNKNRKVISGQERVEDDTLDNVHFLGVVKIGDKYAALLKTSEVKGAFATGERVGLFTISEITQEQVTFTKGEKTYKIKRGDEQ